MDSDFFDRDLSLPFGSPAEKNESTGRSRDSFDGSSELDAGPALGAGELMGVGLELN